MPAPPTVHVKGIGHEELAKVRLALNHPRRSRAALFRAGNRMEMSSAYNPDDDEQFDQSKARRSGSGLRVGHRDFLGAGAAERNAAHYALQRIEKSSSLRRLGTPDSIRISFWISKLRQRKEKNVGNRL
jgi:hypothetical protein